MSAASESKCGWIKKRSRHIKKWRKRFIRIEDDRFLCSYHKEEMKQRTEKIDLHTTVIRYSIDAPKQFQIVAEDTNTEFHFECDSITDANDWLKCLKIIYLSSPPQSPHSANYIYKEIKRSDAKKNDVDLITAQIGSCTDDAEGVKISNKEINQLYMKAITLYQFKHYEECRFVVNSVLTMQPKHVEALQLLTYLANKRVNMTQLQIKQVKERKRFISVPHINLRKNHKNSKKERTEKQEDEAKQAELVHIHPCQVEFNRFIVQKIQLTEYYSDLLKRFKKVKYNDIRFMKDFDETLLRDEIGLRPLHVKCFMRKVEIFLIEVKLFRKWLAKIANNTSNKITSDSLFVSFENNGITTFESLYLHIQSKKDLKTIIVGVIYDDVIYDMLWNEMQRVQKDQRVRMKSVGMNYTMALVGPGFIQKHEKSRSEGNPIHNDMDVIKIINAFTPRHLTEIKDTIGNVNDMNQMNKDEDDDILNEMFVKEEGPDEELLEEQLALDLKMHLEINRTTKGEEKDNKIAIKEKQHQLKQWAVCDTDGQQ